MQTLNMTPNRSIINKLDKCIILKHLLNWIYSEISLCTGKSAGWLPDLQSHTKSVSFVKIKPVNV